MSLLQLLRFSLQTDRLGKASRWQPGKVARVQQQRLRSLVRHAVAHSGYYRDKYRNVEIPRCNLSDLPPITKDEIRPHFDEVVTDPAVTLAAAEAFMADEGNLGRWFLGKYGVSHTSGSQGAPLVIVQDRACLETMYAIMSSRASVANRPGILEAVRRLTHPKRVAVVTFRRGFYPSGASLEFMQQIVGRYVNVQRFSSTQPDLIPALRSFQPNVLVSYASVLEALAAQAGELQLSQLWQVSNSSEQLLPRARARIESAFGVPVLDHYGTGECLLLAEACQTQGGMHVNADWVVLEVVDDQYRPVPAGELGTKVLVTNLANRVQPFIRYEVGDRVAMAREACNCGNRLPRIERIEGRSADLYWVEAAGKLQAVPGVLWHVAVDALRDVREWQAIQIERNRVEIRLLLLPNAAHSRESIKQQLHEKLRELGLPREVFVDAQFVDSIAVDPRTGKLRRIISQVASA